MRYFIHLDGKFETPKRSWLWRPRFLQPRCQKRRGSARGPRCVERAGHDVPKRFGENTVTWSTHAFRWREEHWDTLASEHDPRTDGDQKYLDQLCLLWPRTVPCSHKIFVHERMLRERGW